MILALYSHGSYVGKDTAADAILALAEREGMMARRTSRAAFGDQMKIVCADALGIVGADDHKIATMDAIKLAGEVRHEYWTDERLERRRPPAGGSQDGRDFIIGLADSVRRLDVGFWIQHAMGGPDAMCRDRLHVITDLRFLPEAEAVKAAGGWLVEVERPGQVVRNEDRLPVEMLDGKLRNDSTMQELRRNAEWTLAGLLDRVI